MLHAVNERSWQQLSHWIHVRLLFSYQWCDGHNTNSEEPMDLIFHGNSQNFKEVEINIQIVTLNDSTSKSLNPSLKVFKNTSFYESKTIVLTAPLISLWDGNDNRGWVEREREWKPIKILNDDAKIFIRWIWMKVEMANGKWEMTRAKTESAKPSG